MNLAHVEHYFAPSCRQWKEPMAGSRFMPAKIPSLDPASIYWPRNLFIIGTVNMDGAHPFSDKVLDRAFTFEFWDVDLSA